MKRDLDYVWHLHFVIAKKISLSGKVPRWVLFRTVARRLVFQQIWVYADPRHVNLGSRHE